MGNVLRNRRFGLISLMLMGCSLASFKLLVPLSIDVPVNAPWVRSAMLVIVDLVLVAFIIAMVGVFYDGRKLVAWLASAVSVSGVLFLFETGLLWAGF